VQCQWPSSGCCGAMSSSSTTSERRKPITREDVLGKRIRRVFHVDLPRTEKFQPRSIVIELESGLRFSLEQDSKVVDPVSGLGVLFPYPNSKGLNPVLEAAHEPNLDSPVKAMVTPYGWEYDCGVRLENGYVIHDGFSDWDNGVVFYLPDAETKAALVEFDLPSIAPRPS